VLFGIARVAIAFVAIDLLGIGLFAADAFFKQLGPMMRPRPILAYALAFYLIYAVGLHYLAVLTASTSGLALIRGGIVGAVAYSTYDLTNLSTIDNWPIFLALMDLAWGTVASAVAAWVGFVVTKRIRDARASS